MENVFEVIWNECLETKKEATAPAQRKYGGNSKYVGRESCKKYLACKLSKMFYQ